jgi:hypothetical protein
MSNADENELNNDIGDEIHPIRRQSTGGPSPSPPGSQARRPSSPGFFTFGKKRLEFIQK